MFSKIHWLNEKEIKENTLGIMARPRGNDWLEDEIKGLANRGIDCLVCLLEYHEIIELGLEKERKYAEENNIDFIHFPIEDVNTPKNENDYLKLIEQLFHILNTDKKIVIHCRMGIGRSSVLASGILIKNGVEPTTVFEKISKHRNLNVPDTEVQKNWVLNLANQIVNS